MKTILIISFSNLERDPRVNRQIRFLKDKYNIITAGYGSPNLDKVQYIHLFPVIDKPHIPVFSKLLALPKKSLSAIRLLIGYFDKYYWTKPEIVYAYDQLKETNCDLIISNDIDSLPLSIRLAEHTNSQILFDAHEYAPREWEESIRFRLFFQKFKTYFCNTYIPKVDSMITVCPTIADTYQQDTGINPIVITNAPDYQELEPKFLQNNQKIRLIHHGGSSPSRRIDKMIKMMRYLDDRFELNFLLVGGLPKYNKYLRDLAQDNQNINFLKSVPMRELSGFLNQFDIGVYILEPSNFNNLYALPNKLFEFIQARLAIAIGPSPEMARVVKEHDLGIVAEDFEPKTLAKKIMNLDYEKINYYKNQSHKAAYSLSAESNKHILLNLVQETLNS
ncbi:MAG: glycosyltransferase [Snowella sp.]|nr:glycosyltransferase [Snowella sp.]